eukprot:TRINITY_DN29_c0_g1_i3.p1 TRINITY_DN29_c0_g1~~TRINITY_DN29_c0_g1_i3.p1  ORF type:complete len:314 (+),score=79.70 TRINITY_DN29_c0_g1_i3:134-943(+)
MNFILELCEAVKSKPLSHPCTVSPTVQQCIDILNTLERWVDEIPPIEQGSRYGNKAYRIWFAKVDEESENLMRTIVDSDATKELAGYLVSSIGNYTRIDYGTGHEASFAVWMLCLKKIGVFKPSDDLALVSKLFVKYLEMIRKVQKTYLLEPAGSHGVWGLDDYQFLPFIWGSAQLINHPTIKPKSIHDKDLVNSTADEYLYMGCIQFINQMKKGPFGEHSPKLSDISAVPHQLWEKVNFGMIKMYQLEVLNKFPVIQHFLFGSIIPFE